MMSSSTGTNSFHTNTLQYTDIGSIERNDTVDNNSSNNNNQVESYHLDITSSFEVDFQTDNSSVDINYTNFNNNITASVDDVDYVDETVSIEIADDLIQINYPITTTADECDSTTIHSIPTEIFTTTTTCDEVYDRLQTDGSLPMLDFRRELEKILLACGQDSSSPLEAYNLFNHYIDLLRDYYYELFIEQCKELTTRQQCMVVGDEVLKECTAAMTGSIPHSISIVMQRNESSSDRHHFTNNRSNGYNWSIEVLCECICCSQYLALSYLIASQAASNIDDDFAL